MYLRPRQLFAKFIVEEQISRVDANGRIVKEFQSTGEQLFGVVSSVNPNEVEKWRGLKHEVTHKIVQRLGTIKAQIGDKLICGDKVFIVEAIDDVLNFGQWRIYFVTQRGDVK